LTLLKKYEEDQQYLVKDIVDERTKEIQKEIHSPPEKGKETPELAKISVNGSKVKTTLRKGGNRGAYGP